MPVAFSRERKEGDLLSTDRPHAVPVVKLELHVKILYAGTGRDSRRDRDGFNNFGVARVIRCTGITYCGHAAPYTREQLMIPRRHIATSPHARQIW